MNAGKLKEKISILTLNQNEDTYVWTPTISLWAKVEQLRRGNLFSKVGVGVKTIKFTIRDIGNLTLHNAISWQGKHCFIIDINTIDSRYYEVIAALIDPKTCRVERTGNPKFDDLNRPYYEETSTIIFPGCLIPKKQDYIQGKPMAVSEIRYLLITHKAIELRAGDLVTIENATFTVATSQTLNEYSNEYEIIAKGDA